MGLFKINSQTEFFYSQPDDAKPIGFIKSRQEGRIMRSTLLDGKLFYDQEIHVSYVREFQSMEIMDKRASFDFARDIVSWKKVKKGHALYGKIRPGTFLVMAKYPYANGWVATQSFKSPRTKHSLEEMEQRFTKEYGKLNKNCSDDPKLTFELLVSILDSIGVEPWETSEYLTASLMVPERVKVVNGAQIHQNRHTSKSKSKKSGKRQHEPGDVIGCVDDYEGAISSLKNSILLQRLLVRAEAGHLPLRMRDRKKTLVIHEDVRPLAAQLMERAIRQSLAGPYDSETWLAHNPPDVDRYAAMLFLRHIENHTKQYRRRELKEVSVEVKWENVTAMEEEEQEDMKDEVELETYLQNILNDRHDVTGGSECVAKSKTADIFRAFDIEELDNEDKRDDLIDLYCLENLLEEDHALMLFRVMDNCAVRRLIREKISQGALTQRRNRCSFYSFLDYVSKSLIPELKSNATAYLDEKQVLQAALDFIDGI